jgi:hypothetical protein
MTSHEKRRPRPEDSPSAQALRAAGYVPLPRLWVRQEELDQIRGIAGRHADQVNAIRAAASPGYRPEGGVP